MTTPEQDARCETCGHDRDWHGNDLICAGCEGTPIARHPFKARSAETHEPSQPVEDFGHDAEISSLFMEYDALVKTDALTNSTIAWVHKRAFARGRIVAFVANTVRAEVAAEQTAPPSQSVEDARDVLYQRATFSQHYASCPANHERVRNQGPCSCGLSAEVNTELDAFEAAIRAPAPKGEATSAPGRHVKEERDGG